MDTIVVVPFVRDGSGEYRVSYDPNLASVFFDPNALREAKYSLGARMRSTNAGAGRSTRGGRSGSCARCARRSRLRTTQGSFIATSSPRSSCS